MLRIYQNSINKNIRKYNMLLLFITLKQLKYTNIRIITSKQLMKRS